MNALDLRALFEAVAMGTTTADDAVAQIRLAPFADLGFARVDHHRALRQGRPEAIYAPGKTVEHLCAIVNELLEHETDSGPIIVSRANTEQAAALTATHPGGIIQGDPATIIWRQRHAPDNADTIAVITAGTADLPVADECAWILAAHGLSVQRINDAGVAGIHRILGEVDSLQRATAVVVVAGMEGALASVVGGLTGVPVIAVPTSVGYGSGLDGVTALIAMSASCASGITLVGIDNGFGAACAVMRMVFAMASDKDTQ